MAQEELAMHQGLQTRVWRNFDLQGSACEHIPSELKGYVFLHVVSHFVSRASGAANYEEKVVPTVPS